MTKKTTKKTTSIPENKRRCEICDNELVNDEETYCNKCAGSSDDLIPPVDDEIEEEEE